LGLSLGSLQMLDELRLRDLHLVATCLELRAKRVQFGSQEGCLLAHMLDLLSAAHDLHLQVQLLRGDGVEPASGAFRRQGHSPCPRALAWHRQP
jgi:hypothetical protein